MIILPRYIGMTINQYFLDPYFSEAVFHGKCPRVFFLESGNSWLPVNVV